MDLTGCVALVTGASGDIGGAIARALAGDGVSVAAGYRGERDRAEQVVAEVTGCGVEGWPVQLDQADQDMPQQVVAATVGHFGRLDILVNNAAWNVGVPFGDLEALTPGIWDRMYDTNIRGPFLLARAAAAVMRSQRRGRVVNIASTAGLLPGGSSIAYATSKAALIHLTRCLAVALAPDVLVNCVAPGLVEGTRISARIPPAMLRAIRDLAVLGRSATVEDIAAQVVGFCRTDSITGQVLPIDAGLLPH